jgi:hypothetical protein
MAALGGAGLLTQVMDDAPEELDALQEIFEPDVFVRAMWVRPRIARPEGDDRHRRVSRAADGADRAARRIERIDDGRCSVNLCGRLNRCLCDV